MTFPYEAEQVEYVEMFRHDMLRGEPVSVEKKIVTEKEDIQKLMEGLQRLEMQPISEFSDEYLDVYAFRFHPAEKEQEPYEITYYAYGVKNGILRVQGEETGYFTIANVGWYWGELNKDLIAVHAEIEELPN